MELAHTRDDRLLSLSIKADAEGGVFLGEPVQRLAELVQVPLGLGRERQRHDWRGHVHRRHRVLDLAVREGVA